MIVRRVAILLFAGLALCTANAAPGDLTLELNNTKVLEIRMPDSPSKPEVTSEFVDQWRHITLTWQIDAPIQQDEIAAQFEFLFNPDFHWMPHLAPEEGMCVGQHVFRSPAIIAGKDNVFVAIVPDLDLVGKHADTPWFMDLDAPKQTAWIGMTRHDVEGHVGFRKKPGMTIGPGEVTIAFYVYTWQDESGPGNPFGPVARFLWQRYAQPQLGATIPQVPLDTFVNYTYDWAFDGWRQFVWQEFDLNGKRVGAPQFIVNVSQSPNYPGEWYQRESLSIWNQAWFSSLRSATGLARWARRTDDAALEEKARMTLELALSAPQKDGVFPAVYWVDGEEFMQEADGRKLYRPKGWDQGYWTNSTRTPHTFGVDRDWYHVLDASWTCLLMLRWHEEIEADSRIVDYAKAWADKLLTLQGDDGFFPTWLHPETLEPSPVLKQSPEDSMSVTFLLKLSGITGEAKYADAALRCMEAVWKGPVIEGRWEDFETYWSCNGYGNKDLVGKKVARNDLYKQNNFSMFWTAEALLNCYRHTKDQDYLWAGRRVIDELSMTQQVWNPPYMYVPVLGGFGVMNYDGEWNDSRQSLFAELYMDYYKATGDPMLFERGVAALRVAFVLMYCPENPFAKEQHEKAFPFFGPEDYGYMGENYGHGGTTSPEGGGLAPFTIYDWGNGAASEARNRIFDHYGDVYIDLNHKQAFAIDAVRVEAVPEGWNIINPLNAPHPVTIVTSAGTRHTQEVGAEPWFVPFAGL